MQPGPLDRSMGEMVWTEECGCVVQHRHEVGGVGNKT
jgi:hypothetical protein